MGLQEKPVRYSTSGVRGPQKRKPPPPLQPSASARTCVVLASCLRHTCNKGKTTRAPSPPPPHTPRPPRGWGMTVAERGPPPEDKAAGWGGSGERVQAGPRDRAKREHAPCKPQRGDHRGCDRRVGRATTGTTRQAPPPAAEGQVPRLMPAPCSRRAYARGQAARKSPPPHPLLLQPPKKGARTATRQRGDMGGGGGQRTN